MVNFRKDKVPLYVKVAYHVQIYGFYEAGQGYEKKNIHYKLLAHTANEALAWVTADPCLKEYSWQIHARVRVVDVAGTLNQCATWWVYKFNPGRNELSDNPNYKHFLKGLNLVPFDSQHPESCEP
jgi:hypothetical protein